GGRLWRVGVLGGEVGKRGAWMEWVKSALGILLVALAATYIRDAFPVLRTAASSAARAWGAHGGVWLAAGLAAAGILLGAIHRSFRPRPPPPPPTAPPLPPRAAPA